MSVGGAEKDCSHGAPASVRLTQTLKNERAEKDPEPSPADSAVAQPFAFRHARRLPCPSCLYTGQHLLHVEFFQLKGWQHAGLG